MMIRLRDRAATLKPSLNITRSINISTEVKEPKMWHIFHSNGQGRTQRRVSGALKPPFSRKINENYEQNPYKKLSRKEQIIKCKHEKTEVGAIFRS